MAIPSYDFKDIPQEILGEWFSRYEQSEPIHFRPLRQIEAVVEAAEYEDGPWFPVQTLEVARMFSHLRIRRPVISGVMVVTPEWVNRWNGRGEL